jgi:hypothetical protein
MDRETSLAKTLFIYFLYIILFLIFNSIFDVSELFDIILPNIIRFPKEVYCSSILKSELFLSQVENICRNRYEVCQVITNENDSYPAIVPEISVLEHYYLIFGSLIIICFAACIGKFFLQINRLIRSIQMI